MRRLPCRLSLTTGLRRRALGRRELPFQLKHIVLGPSRTLLGMGLEDLHAIAQRVGAGTLAVPALLRPIRPRAFGVDPTALSL